MANDKVEPWIDKMGDAVIAYVSERYDHAYGIYPLTLKELLAHHAAPVLAEKDAEIARLKDACIKQSHDIEQTLGKALGYPWYKDDQKNFPGTTEADGVCTGEHVAESIAMEAATQIATLKDYSDRWPGNMMDDYQAMQEEYKAIQGEQIRDRIALCKAKNILDKRMKDVLEDKTDE